MRNDSFRAYQALAATVTVNAVEECSSISGHYAWHANRGYNSFIGLTTDPAISRAFSDTFSGTRTLSLGAGVCLACRLTTREAAAMGRDIPAQSNDKEAEQRPSSARRLRFCSSIVLIQAVLRLSLFFGPQQLHRQPASVVIVTHFQRQHIRQFGNTNNNNSL